MIERTKYSRYFVGKNHLGKDFGKLQSLAIKIQWRIWTTISEATLYEKKECFLMINGALLINKSTRKQCNYIINRINKLNRW